MKTVLRCLFIVLLSLSADAADKALLPGQVVADFSLPSALNDRGQRLAEQKGQRVMLIRTGRCNQCEELLASYQLLAESHAHEGLVSWVIWTPHGRDQPPQLRIPVLTDDARWHTGWQPEPLPAVMLIGADGVLDYLISGNLKRHYPETEQTLLRWMQQTQHRP